LDEKAFRDMAETQSQHWWFRARREILKDQIRRLKMRAGATILEIGTGTGGNLKMLAAQGQLTAVEKNKFAREYASRQSGQTVLEGWLPENLPMQDTRYDLICLFDVLEHIEEDQSSLATLQSRLNTDGKLLITVPAYQWLFGHHDRILHHYRRYNLEGLRRLLASCGYQIDRASYFNTLLFPLIALVRLLESLSGSKRGVGDQTPKAPLNSLLYQIFRLELYLLRQLQLPFGTSIIICASIRK